MQQFVPQSPAQEQAAMSLMFEMEIMATQRLLTGVTEHCFSRCANSFRTKTLETQEQACITNCTLKFMKSMQRVRERLGEENSKYMQQQQ
eukprot:g32885.t1